MRSRLSKRSRLSRLSQLTAQDLNVGRGTANDQSQSQAAHKPLEGQSQANRLSGHRLAVQQAVMGLPRSRALARSQPSLKRPPMTPRHVGNPVAGSQQRRTRRLAGFSHP